MPGTKKVGSLQVNEDLEFQQKEWRVERIGWVVMAGIILLALLGLFGGGPISKATQESNGLELTYERLDRTMNPSTLILELPVEAISEGQVRFWVDREYLEKVQIEDISPDPDNVEVTSERMIYTINVADPSQPVTVKMDIEMEEGGLVQGQVGLDGGDGVSFSQFVYP